MIVDKHPSNQEAIRSRIRSNVSERDVKRADDSYAAKLYERHVHLERIKLGLYAA